MVKELVYLIFFLLNQGTYRNGSKRHNQKLMCIQTPNKIVSETACHYFREDAFLHTVKHR